jgi:hypothetical protein
MVLLTLWATFYVWSAGGPMFFINWQRIEPGDPKEFVVSALGPPDASGAEFHLAQRDNFEADYRAAEQSGAAQYLFWNHGEVVYAVGFDSAGYVKIKAYGGT